MLVYDLLCWHAVECRHILEQLEQLEPRVSALDEDLSDAELEEEEEEEEEEGRDRHSPSPTHKRHASPSHRRWVAGDSFVAQKLECVYV